MVNDQPNIYFCGDTHGYFKHVIEAVERNRPDAVIFLGDLEAQQPLHIELAPIIDKTIIRFVHGNHDTDTLEIYENLFQSELADCNLDGRVENIGGLRIAGLGGVFRRSIWMPPTEPLFISFNEFSRKLNESRPLRERCQASPVLSKQERTHRSTIFHETYANLLRQRADILISHEAPSSHQFGFPAIDHLARAMGVGTAYHGHHHDRPDYRSQWESLGFRAFAIGFRGITSLAGEVICPGHFD